MAEQIVDLPTISNLLLALSSLVAAVASLASVVQGHFLSKRAANNTLISQNNTAAINAVATQVTVVDAKVDGVVDQTNGHMSSMIAALTPTDPSAATAAAAKLVETAERVAERLKATAEAAEKPPPKNILP